MATFRIYYLEREAKDGAPADLHSLGVGMPAADSESEWEETYDGSDTDAALEAFFTDHGGRDNVHILEEDGSPRPVGGGEMWDADRTYVWIEEGKLMEYQGLDVATPGMVACPLCDGTGEVDEATAEQFAEEFQPAEDGA